jgi:hypothetical protein
MLVSSPDEISLFPLFSPFPRSILPQEVQDPGSSVFVISLGVTRRGWWVTAACFKPNYIRASSNSCLLKSCPVYYYYWYFVKASRTKKWIRSIMMCIPLHFLSLTFSDWSVGFNKVGFQINIKQITGKKKQSSLIP